MEKSNTSWIISLLLLTGLVAAAYLYFRTLPEPPGPPLEESTETRATESESRSPRYPVPPVPSPRSGELVPLPALDDSDAYFRLGLTEVFGRAVDDVLVDSGLIDRFVATVDNLPRRHVAEQIRPLRPVPGSFQAETLDQGKHHAIRPDNYLRYEPLVASLTAADIDDVVDMYRRFYPLLQEAYIRLGYPDGYFNDRVIEVIDHLLETPEPVQAIVLTRPNVLYEFADPALEALSSGQKVLLRTGGENAAQIRQFLTTLRARLDSFD